MSSLVLLHSNCIGFGHVMGGAASPGVERCVLLTREDRIEPGKRYRMDRASLPTPLTRIIVPLPEEGAENNIVWEERIFFRPAGSEDEADWRKFSTGVSSEIYPGWEVPFSPEEGQEYLIKLFARKRPPIPQMHYEIHLV